VPLSEATYSRCRPGSRASTSGPSPTPIVAEVEDDQPGVALAGDEDAVLLGSVEVDPVGALAAVQAVAAEDGVAGRIHHDKTVVASGGDVDAVRRRIVLAVSDGASNRHAARAPVSPHIEHRVRGVVLVRHVDLARLRNVGEAVGIVARQHGGDHRQP
jgi:hypothetical protein